VTDAAQRLRPIDSSHAAAAPVTGLAPPKFRGDDIEIDGEPRRNAFEDGDQRLAVRLASGQKRSIRAHSIRKFAVWTRFLAVPRDPW
jgi:hypothetical protein